MRADDAPLTIPDRAWMKRTHAANRAPGSPPPPGEEAAYDWYRAQYPDPRIFAPIGPPGDPAEAAVSPRRPDRKCPHL